ncbi:pyrimidine dimer DNA glycosylase/endonuclease V [Ancylomarina sp.]|uniref:pyrimidine dimer DNA glycosylase/endonuclease V n=1 Tax=Ancylomarina sp. TaxID=1970196 RepID=UPI00356A6A61
MRIWSLHPKHLDVKGLVALWRETLLAKNVLEGQTKAYNNHPQLDRFKKSNDPIGSIHYYLSIVWQEANLRGYKFDNRKYENVELIKRIELNKGQIEFEKEHLLKKLRLRDEIKYAELLFLGCVEIHPLFNEIEGGIEEWEKI